MKRSHLAVLLVIATALLVAAPPVFCDAGPDGAAIYKSKCAMCHGAEGAGQTPTGKSMKVRDLRGAEVQKMTDADLAQVISDGKGTKMPAYKSKLSKVEIDAVVAYLRELAKKK